MTTEYTPPVSELLTYGKCKNTTWPNYLELGLDEMHIPQLIQMATDEELNWSDAKSPEFWAPVHAWRALGQLRAEAAIEPLMELFFYTNNLEWAGDELPQVYGMIGAAALPVLQRYLANPSYGLYPRMTVAASIKEIVENHPQTREACIEVLSEELKSYKHNEILLNHMLIHYLAELKEVDSIQLIQRTFAEESVDETVMGDIEDVELELGLRKRRSTPKNRQPSVPSALSNFVESLPQVRAMKVGRNDPCPCGSGKKYKKCCLNKA